MTESTRLEHPLLRIRFLDSDGDPYQTTIATNRRQPTGMTDTMKGKKNESVRAFQGNVLRLAKMLCQATNSTLVSIELIGGATFELEYRHVL